jgi:hypothetical protein
MIGRVVHMGEMGRILHDWLVGYEMPLLADDRPVRAADTRSSLAHSHTVREVRDPEIF